MPIQKGLSLGAKVWVEIWLSTQRAGSAAVLKPPKRLRQKVEISALAIDQVYLQVVAPCAQALLQVHRSAVASPQ
jgi:hypothetical protein